ncbi:MAG: hypothetical protein NZ480_04060 [Bdellovibrionaceae bacterium]|nr:hypothetical protein [Pseudobdellovibrionaceae bacterium]MDW8191157.1 helix-turn-helix domain-containing protein [Pseudobdellovibrionaceae bacterium]
MKNKLILISENLELMQKLRAWVDALVIEGGVQLEIFNKKGWIENLENPFLRSKLMDRPMLLPGLKTQTHNPMEFEGTPESGNVINMQSSASPYVQVVAMDEIEKAVILQAIDTFKGNMSLVAKALKVGRATLYRKLKKYGIGTEYLRQSKSQGRRKVA